MINPIINYLIGAGLIFLAVFFAASLVFSVLSFAPWVPSRSRDLARIFKLAGLKPGQIFYDLGCGDGKIVLCAANNFKAKAMGLEISLPLYLICRLRQALNRQSDISFKFRNLFKENLSAADAVYFFGMPKSIKEKLSAKLKSELKPGAKIISYAFSLPGWEPVAVDKPGEKDLAIYLYIN
ncbi:MAG: class I SAM-dependent methyltransferase [bacterium]|nr:class I SAM-dependent methyltransferase [bacterium]